MLDFLSHEGNVLYYFFLEMYFKTTKRYCYTSIRMAKMKVRIPSIGKNTEQPELS